MKIKAFWLVLVASPIAAPPAYNNLVQQINALMYSVQPVQKEPEPKPQAPIAVQQQLAPQQTVTTNITSATDLATSPSDPTVMQDITNTLIPLIISPALAKMLAQDTTQMNFDEQLDTAYGAAAFLTKLSTKMESLSDASLDYIKSPQFADHAFAKRLLGVVLAFQSIFDERLEAYKNMKPQPTIIKEIKKVIVQQKKTLEKLLQDRFGIENSPA